MPQPTATRTAGAPITFDTLANPDRVLIGQEASSALDFGNGAWWLASAWGKLTTNSISFNGGGPTSAAVRLTTPLLVVQLDAYNGGSTNSTVTISCTGQTSKVVTVVPGAVQTITTGFTGSCTSLTIGSSNGWYTNFDNLYLQ